MSEEKKPESPALLAARERAAAAKAKSDAARAALTAEQQSEQAQIERLELERAAAEREAVRLQRERDAEPIYRKACLEHGEHRVARIHSLCGPIVIRPMSEIEVDDLDARQEALKTSVERRKAAVEAAIETCLYPKGDELRQIIADHPAIVVDLFRARDEIQDGVRTEARGKG